VYIKAKKVGDPCTISHELNVDKTDELNHEELISDLHSPQSIDKSEGCASLNTTFTASGVFELLLAGEQVLANQLCEQLQHLQEVSALSSDSLLITTRTLL